MTLRKPTVTPPLFDTSTGELVLGAAAAEQRMTQVGPAVVSLGQLVTAEHFPFKTGDFALPDTGSWTPEDHITFGNWALRLVQQENHQPRPLERQHVRRLRILGLGPPTVQIGDFGLFKEAIGSPVEGDNQRYRRRFRDDTSADVMKKCAQLSRKVGKITKAAYITAAKHGKVPPLAILYETVGGINEANDLLGFPHIPSWEHEDYMQYGMDLLHANGPELFISPTIDFIARRKRGPWLRTIREQFHTWTNYQQEVSEQWNEVQTLRDQRIERYRTQILQGTLPADLKELDDDDLLRAGGHWRVARECLPKAEDSVIANAARIQLFGDFVNRLRSHSKHITHGYVEMVAESRDLLPDIRPVPPKPYLQISPEEIQSIRAARQDKYAQWKQSTKA